MLINAPSFPRHAPAGLTPSRLSSKPLKHSRRISLEMSYIFSMLKGHLTRYVFRGNAVVIHVKIHTRRPHANPSQASSCSCAVASGRSRFWPESTMTSAHPAAIRSRVTNGSALFLEGNEQTQPLGGFAT